MLWAIDRPRRHRALRASLLVVTAHCDQQGSPTDSPRHSPVDHWRDGQFGYREVILVSVALALASSPAQHLLEQDAALDGPQEDDELEIGDVDAGRQQIDGDRDAGIGAMAELPDALQRPVDPAGDFLDESVAATEGVTREMHELISVTGVAAPHDAQP
jgi:hypothetical protein